MKKSLILIISLFCIGFVVAGTLTYYQNDKSITKQSDENIDKKAIDGKNNGDNVKIPQKRLTELGYSTKENFEMAWIRDNRVYINLRNSYTQINSINKPPINKPVNNTCTCGFDLDEWYCFEYCNHTVTTDNDTFNRMNNSCNVDHKEHWEQIKEFEKNKP